MRRTRIGIGGMRRNVEVIAPLLQQHTDFTIVPQPSLRRKVPPWTMIYRLWRYIDDVDLYYGISYGQWPRYLFARLRGRRAVCHWAGTDVLRVLQRPLDRWWFQVLIRHCIDRHLAVSKNLAEELATLDVSAQIVPLLSDVMGEVVPLPSAFTVLAYMPVARGPFYGAPVIYEVAARNPQWRFLIVGRGSTPEGQALANVTELGQWVDLVQVYPQVSVLVRPTLHDGLPRMVLEALSWGRYVVFSRPFPHTLMGQTADEVEMALQTLSEHRDPNWSGAQYVRQTYSKDRIAAKLQEVFDDVLAG